MGFSDTPIVSYIDEDGDKILVTSTPSIWNFYDELEEVNTLLIDPPKSKMARTSTI